MALDLYTEMDVECKVNEVKCLTDEIGNENGADVHFSKPVASVHNYDSGVNHS
jgi:hypothetical protein